MFKERLETGANFYKFYQKSELLAKRAPTWLGRLAALTLIAFVAREEYHTESSAYNSSTETQNTQELAPFATLLVEAIVDHSNSIVERNLPEPTPKAKEEIVTNQQRAGEAGELSRITGYYCQQVPGYPVGDGGGYCGNTASGEPPKSGSAACGEKWPLGAKLRIEGYGEVICTDRGQLGWNQVDIFFPTNRDLAQSSKPDWAKVSQVK